VETLWTFCHAEEILLRSIRDLVRVLHRGAASFVLSLVPAAQDAQNARRPHFFTVCCEQP
jgi:hypothetical protein